MSADSVFVLNINLQMNINLKYLGIKIYDIDQCILTWKEKYKILLRSRKASCKSMQ